MNKMMFQSIRIVFALFLSISLLVSNQATASTSTPNSTLHLDPTFGQGGMVITDVGKGGEDNATAYAVLPDGSIMLGGTGNKINDYLSQDFALARLTPDFQPDRGFGRNGRQMTTVSSALDAAYAMAIQSDQKIVQVGTDGSNFALLRYNPNGSLDTSFDGNGIQTTSISAGQDIATDIAIQADGKIVITGQNDDSVFSVARYSHLDGSLDATFGTGGIVRTDIGNGYNKAYALAIDGDQKILTAGSAIMDYQYLLDFALVRYNTDGSLDTSFSDDGIVTTPIAPDDHADEAYAMLVQSDDKIVLGGFTFGSGILDDSFALVRYNTDGSLDGGFNGTGILTIPLTAEVDHIYALAQDSNQKLIAGGYADGDLGMVRLNADGTLDTSFSDDGKMIDTGSWSFNTNLRDLELKVLSDGKIMVAGSGIGPNGSTDFMLARYNSDGSLDTTFADNGYKLVPVVGANDYGYAMAVAADDSIIMAGGTDNLSDEEFHAFGVIYGLDGDISFAGVDTSTIWNYINDVVIQSADGKIVTSGVVSLSTDDALVSRTNSDGTPDTTFGGGFGGVNTDINGNEDEGWQSVVLPDGKILLAIASEGAGISNFTLVRYNIDGTLDETFDGDGILTISFSDWDFSYALEVQPDGKIILAGITWNAVQSSYEFAVARFTSSGILDPTFSGDGKLVTDFDSSILYDITLDAGGNIILAGEVDGTFALVRIDDSGNLDPAFGTDGLVTNDFSETESAAFCVFVLPDERIIAGGYVFNGSTNDIAVALFNSDGTLDNTFGMAGSMTLDLGYGNDYVYDIAMQSNGAIVLGGYGNTGYDRDLVLLRLVSGEVYYQFLPAITR